jgi:hypothetical protein
VGVILPIGSGETVLTWTATCERRSKSTRACKLFSLQSSRLKMGTGSVSIAAQQNISGRKFSLPCKRLGRRSCGRSQLLPNAEERYEKKFVAAPFEHSPNFIFCFLLSDRADIRRTFRAGARAKRDIHFASGDVASVASLDRNSANTRALINSHAFGARTLRRSGVSPSQLKSAS